MQWRIELHVVHITLLLQKEDSDIIGLADVDDVGILKIDTWVKS